MSTMKAILDQNKVVCVYGAHGVGKTYAVMKALEDESYIEITLDNHKQFEIIEESTSHVIVDDIDTDTHAWHGLVLRGKLSRGSTVYITNNTKGLEAFDCIHLEPLETTYQSQIARQLFPDVDPIDAIRRGNGNLKNMISYLNGWGVKDVFMSPKDVIHDLLCKSKLPISDYIGRTVEEHGYSCGIVHENYVDIHDIDIVRVSENLSIAEVYDNEIYQGNWELLPYFCHHGIVSPSIDINHRLIREVVRPGSSWTKFNNFKMRSNKLKVIIGRCRNLSLDKLHHIRTMCLTTPDSVIATLVYYKLTPPDLDVLNHLGPLTKIKPRVVKKLKKDLANALG
jgi:hypothetical protein